MDLVREGQKKREGVRDEKIKGRLRGMGGEGRGKGEGRSYQVQSKL